MVGLSVILEQYEALSAKPCPQVISKGNMMIKPPSPFPSPNPKSPSGKRFPDPPSFLDNCFLCNQKLLPAKDIFMYKGDKAFCSEECRCRQIFMDEEEASAAKSGCTREYNCSLAATSSSSSSSSSGRTRGGKGRRNAVAY